MSGLHHSSTSCAEKEVFNIKIHLGELTCQHVSMAGAPSVVGKCKENTICYVTDEGRNY